MIRAFMAATTLALGTALAAQPALADHHETMEKSVSADILDANGRNVGMVTLVQTPNGVLISATASGMPEGEHGFHIHETGRCDAGQGFSTAGGHYAPRGAGHGFKEAGGPHAGDMPNQFVGSDGTLRAHVVNDRITLESGFSSLMDADGSALVIHAGADDYMSQPSGDAGNRLACAVLAAPK